jgi:hypothetical protein
MSVAASFLIKGSTGAYLAEEELEWHIEELKTFDTLQGSIVFVSGPNRVTLDDDLDYLIPLLCFAFIPKLANNESVELTRASASGSYFIKADNQHVWLSSVTFSATSFYKKEFLKATVQCGLRFLDLISRLNEGTGRYQVTIDELEVAKIEAQRLSP